MPSDTKEYLHCWVNENHELQIEIDDAYPRVKAAFCLPLDDVTFRELLECYLYVLQGNDDEYRFPGRFIELREDDHVGPDRHAVDCLGDCCVRVTKGRLYYRDGVTEVPDAE